ncbi:MAG: tRNA lysidine(34) synthetase TilS [Nitrosomonas sp.]|nr:tRNA lysidine(34) synthetase TilS [Nitrosomonas sp.]MDP1950052.1 tRNA lysidine(34) synthetase TilS [Nitrosomonas sp.]
MAHSRKSKSSSLVDCTKEVIQTYTRQNEHLIVALSGGVDSVVLLNLLVKLANPMKFKLSAIHIDHGISRNANQWAKFCCTLCCTLDVPITVTHLKIKKESGISLEAAARDARYQVFNHLKADYIVLAQHQDDQAETLLLQLLRGAGVKGLASMPVLRKQASKLAPQILRPLLTASRRAIEEYARQNKIDWIIDESNENIAFNRNFLRHEIFPLLRERYPSYKKTFLRTTRHLAEASDLLDELAALDEKNCTLSGKIRIDNLRKLSLPRARNLLRYTLSQQNITSPSTIKLENLLRQLLSSSTDTKLHFAFCNAEIRCHKGLINILPKNIFPDEKLLTIWHGEEKIRLQQLNGTINFSHEENTGINLMKLTMHNVTIRLRVGGERIRPDSMRPRRSLKNLLQEASIPPWERRVLPLLFSGDQLVWVPGIGVDHEFQVTPGESGLVPVWRPDR